MSRKGVWFNFSLKRNNLITGSLIWPIKLLTMRKREQNEKLRTTLHKYQLIKRLTKKTKIVIMNY